MSFWKRWRALAWLVKAGMMWPLVRPILEELTQQHPILGEFRDTLDRAYRILTGREVDK